MLNESENLPPLTAVRAFEAAARLNSFSRAAAELGMTSAAVSYQIKQLERRMGVILFVRHARQVELTAQGALIGPVLSETFATMRSAFAHAVESSDQTLSLTTLPTVGAAWLAPKLGRFHNDHPGIRIALDLSVAPTDFGTGQFDAAVRSGNGAWPGLRADDLVPNLYMPVCSPAMRDAARRLETPEAPLGFALLGRPNWWANWFAAAGWPDLDLTGRFGTDFGAEHMCVTAAIAGHGVALASPIFFARELASGSLVPAHDLVVADGRRYWFTWPSVRAGSAKVQAFRSWIRDEAAQDLSAARPYLQHCVTVTP